MAIRGVMIDRMMTWPISSMIVIRTSISMCSLSRRFWDFRTAMTTAVDEPDMMAPSTMDWVMSNPRNVPAMNPPKTMSGSWITATSMAKEPCLRIFLMLISRPMQNISMTNPISFSSEMISSSADIVSSSW